MREKQESHHAVVREAVVAVNVDDRKCVEIITGLKPFGFELVEKMNEMGMVIDVSHLSEGGFWDVAEHSKNLLLYHILVQGRFVIIREI